MQKPAHDALSEIIAERKAGWQSLPAITQSQPDLESTGLLKDSQSTTQQAIRERMIQDTKGTPPNQALSAINRAEAWQPAFRRQASRLPDPSFARISSHHTPFSSDHNPAHTSTDSQENIPNPEKAPPPLESILLQHPHLQAPVPVKLSLVESFLGQGYRRLSEHRHQLNLNK
jgi:hypothetical protein